MRRVPDTFPPHLSLAQLQLVNARCDRFEAAWRAGQRPRIEEHLTDGPAADHLLQQLILLDIDYRRRHGDAPLPDEYRARFPALDAAWLTAALAEAATGEPPEGPGISPGEFLDRLAQRGLLPEGLRGPPETTAAALAHRLVAEGKLAEHQARALAAPVPVPLVLGPYVLDGWIASGGMGAVFRATHGRMKRVVAVKVVQGEAAARPELLRRFQQEVEVAARLRHPNIVTAFDAGEQDGVAYLVTEFVDGEDLRRLVERDGPLTVDRAVAVVRQAALGLAHAHGQGVVHRDVKPSNLLLGRDGVVRVLDVGLARVAAPPDGPRPALTEVGVVMGTADYMAPEQGEDPRHVDARADVYGLGCTLYYLLTGRPPYDGATTVALLVAHRHAPVPSLRPTRPDVPPALDRLFGRMAAKAPADRPPDMAAVLEALDDAVAPRPRQRFPRRRLFAALGAVALVVVAVLVGLLLVDRSAPPAASPPALPPRARVPFDAAAEQRRWAAALGVPATTENAAGVKLVLVPPGSFVMGTPDAELQELLRRTPSEDDAAFLRTETQREVVIRDAFYLSATEVTVGQFRRFVQATGHVTLAEKAVRDEEGGWGWHPQEGWRRKRGCSWQNADQHPLGNDHPVGNVSWDDAQAFCRWLQDRTGSECRLPTEAEWEFACRAGGAGRWCFGDDGEQLPLFAWTAGDSGGVFKPVAGKRANALGLHDMHGNLLEWCQLPKHPVALDRPTAAKPGPWVEAYQPVRGGSFRTGPDRTRSAARGWEHPNEFGPGFRVLQVVGGRR